MENNRRTDQHILCLTCWVSWLEIHPWISINPRKHYSWSYQGEWHLYKMWTIRLSPWQRYCSLKTLSSVRRNTLWWLIESECLSNIYHFLTFAVIMNQSIMTQMQVNTLLFYLGALFWFLVNLHKLLIPVSAVHHAEA